MTPLELMEEAEPLSALYTGLETDLIKNIADCLATDKLETDTAKWKIKKLAQLGALNQKNIKLIAEYAKIAPTLLEIALTNSALKTIEEIEPMYRTIVKDGIIKDTTVPLSTTVENSIKAYYKQADDALNLVNTTMSYKANIAAQKVINDTAELAQKQSYIDMLNKSTGKVVTGIESRQSALRQTITEMADKGIPAFTDKLGREWSPEGYINMCIRTTNANVARQVTFDRMDAYGISLIEIDSHSGARPKCAKDQGRIFDRTNKSTKYPHWSASSFGDKDGLFGINCRHRGYPFVDGEDIQRYYPIDKEKNDKVYKQAQKQRELERNVRTSKRECIALDSVDDKEGFQKASVKLKERENRLKQYCKDTNRAYKPDRTAVVGYNKSLSQKTLKSYKNDLYNRDYESIINLKGTLSNYDARKWYIAQDNKIPSMIDKRLSLENQARQACELRNTYRTQARELMKDQNKRKELDKTDPNKTFEELLEDKIKRKHITKEEAVQDILKTATKTRESVNKKFGLE